MSGFIRNIRKFVPFENVLLYGSIVYNYIPALVFMSVEIACSIYTFFVAVMLKAIIVDKV